ncbi:MAG: SDR family oxidoreductase, partial [Clostridia bacterium]|nr:SDR family oxidoreductase [Clostridia bacterium]
EPVLAATTWEGVEEAVEKLAKISPSSFAYLYAQRCISYYAAQLSAELGAKGIRVNTVLPGSTNTGMKDEFQKLAGGEEALLKEAGIAARLATPEEMAWPIVFLGADVCSFVSGLEFNVDFADTMMKKLKLKKDVVNIPMTNKLVVKAASIATKKNNAYTVSNKKRELEVRALFLFFGIWLANRLTRLYRSSRCRSCRCT